MINSIYDLLSILDLSRSDLVDIPFWVNSIKALSFLNEPFKKGIGILHNISFIIKAALHFLHLIDVKVPFLLHLTVVNVNL